MFGNHKEIKEREKSRLEHQREISRQSSARYRKKHKSDIKVKEAMEILKIYDDYNEKKPEYVGY